MSRGVSKHWWTLRVGGGGRLTRGTWPMRPPIAYSTVNQDGETAPIPHSHFRAKAEPEPATRGNPKSTSVIDLVRFDSLKYFAVRASPYANANAKAKCTVLVVESNAVQSIGCELPSFTSHRYIIDDTASVTYTYMEYISSCIYRS